MSSDIVGWIELAVLAFHIFDLIKGLLAKPRRRTRHVERFRSFKVWGVEWKAHDREDDIRS
jgi:hypothetical protein